MKKIGIATVLILLHVNFVGCKKTSNPIDSGSVPLEQKIIGTWNSPSYSITFNDDHTFAKMFLKHTDPNKIHPDTLLMKGNYQIENNILQLKDVYFDRVDSLAPGVGFYTEPPNEEISIEDNTLRFKAILVFSPDTANPSTQVLRGKWYRDGWYCGYFPDNSIPVTHGKFEEDFTFGDDSTNCYHHIKYDPRLPILIDSEISRNDSYRFQDSVIDIVGYGFRNCRVRFKADKMLWYIDDSDELYTRK